jgi:hypothetical protein
LVVLQEAYMTKDVAYRLQQLHCGEGIKVALELAKAFANSIMKDPVPIEGSNGMSVLRDVIHLEICNCTKPFWDACIDISETPNKQAGIYSAGQPMTSSDPPTHVMPSNVMHTHAHLGSP